MNHSSVDLYGDLLFESCANSNGQANAKNNNINSLPISGNSQGGDSGETPTPAVESEGTKLLDTIGRTMGGVVTTDGKPRTSGASFDDVFLEEILSLDSRKEILLQKVRYNCCVQYWKESQ